MQSHWYAKLSKRRVPMRLQVDKLLFNVEEFPEAFCFMSDGLKVSSTGRLKNTLSLMQTLGQWNSVPSVCSV